MPKAELRHAFSTCVIYCMGLHFQSNYVGLSQPKYFFEIATACSKRTLKLRVATNLKELLNNSFSLFKSTPDDDDDAREYRISHKFHKVARRNQTQI